MFAAIVSTAFWAIFSVISLATLAVLLGTVWRNTQFTTARAHADDGSEDPESSSYKVYELSLSSTALAVAAGVSSIPLMGAAAVAFVGTTVISAALALTLAGVMFVIADAIRGRHEKLETGFREITGMDMQTVYAHIIDRQTTITIPNEDDRSAPTR